MGDAVTQEAHASGTAAVVDSAVIASGDHVDRVVVARNTPLLARCFLAKPLSVVHAEESEGVLERSLGFWDLFALGFGGTVGSGVFVMAGLICHEIAGPAGVFSWIVAGFGCLLSAMSFAELSWRVPSAGGAYAYAFVALGELPAAIVGWCMTLEYGISGAAVAKSWGEMLSVGLAHASADASSEEAGADVPDKVGGFNAFGMMLDIGGVYAALLQAACVLVVVGGLEASKYTVNSFCVAKAVLVVFMTATAFSLWNSDNLVPLAPFGATGVLKGAVAAFFGFLGFDEVVLLAPEAKSPARDVPRALFGSLLGVTLVCAAASVALSGAEAAPDLDADSAFAEAFRRRGLTLAYKITAIGELATLPLVVLVSFMAQPRLLFAMAKDGLLPHLFAEVDSRGTLLKGSLVSGAVCMVTALVVPFDSLNTIISAGVLLAFNFVTSSVLVLRHRACLAPAPSSTAPPSAVHSLNVVKYACEDPPAKEGIKLVFIANLTACASAGVALWAGNSAGASGAMLTLVAVGLGAAMLYVSSGLQSHATSPDTDISGGNYLSPLFPWPQAVALWVNWFLVCQLPLDGLLALLAYVAFAAVHYACYGAHRSVGNCTGWSTILLAAAAGAGPGRCVSLSADDLENALMSRDDVNVDSNARGHRSHRSHSSGPTAEQPLLAPEEEEEDDRDDGQVGQVAAGSSSGDGGTMSLPQAPVVTVMSNTQQQTPAATSSSHEQLVRRRSLDAHSFRSAQG
eukprot:g16477.t1